jgi:hypothetical protein
MLYLTHMQVHLSATLPEAKADHRARTVLPHL